ncbi:MAG TPA: o-succinylbenzoate synthase, partial [Nitrospiria bacterium]|nr:o-succinylbenzoate synthase [Nitrospiria bacterium]
MLHIELPLLSPFRTSLGVEENRSALILIYKSNGITAFSECATFENPYYTSEDNKTAIHVIQDHLAKGLPTEPSPGEFLERVALIKGHNMAKAAVEMLLWDYHCKARKEPLARALGKSKGYAEIGISLGIDSVDRLLEKVTAARDRGYKRIKIKIKRGREYELVHAVRDSF